MLIYGNSGDPYYQNIEGQARSLDGFANLLLTMGMSAFTTIDVGANIGLSTLLMSRFARKVIAVEPSATNVGFLRQNLEVNSIENVEVIHAAASNAKGMLNFHEASFGAGSHIVQNEHLLCDSIQKIEVSAIPLDSVSSTPIDFIKIDAEGHEPEVLAGAQHLLFRDRPKIYMEINVWCLTAFGGHSPGAFVSRIWEAFEVSAPNKDGSLTRLFDPYSFLHDAIALHAGIADVVLVPRPDIPLPTLRELTWPRSALAAMAEGPIRIQVAANN